MFFGKGSETIDEVLSTKSFDSIDGKVSNLNIRISYGDKFEVHFHGEKENKPNLKIENGILVFNQPEKVSHTFKIEIFNFNKEDGVFITVPKNCNLNDIKMKNASGNVRVNELSIENLNIHLASGNVNILKSKADNLNLQTASGNISITEVASTSLIAQAASGNIKVRDSSILDEAKLSVASGNILVKGSEFSSYQVTTLSGQKKLDEEILNSQSGQETPRLFASALSGNVQVGK